MNEVNNAKTKSQKVDGKIQINAKYEKFTCEIQS